MVGSRAKCHLYLVEPVSEPNNERSPGRQSAGDSTSELELWSDRSADEIADLDMRLVGMSVALRVMLRFMKD